MQPVSKKHEKQHRSTQGMDSDGGVVLYRVISLLAPQDSSQVRDLFVRTTTTVVLEWAVGGAASRFL